MPGSTAQRPTILVVDDIPENLALMGELLRPHYQVRVANSGARALRVATTGASPDLILLDVMMPDMDGYEVLRQLRSHPQGRTVPVIFVTAMDTDRDETVGLEIGAVDYITKPVRPPVLLARVRTQIELKQARDQLRDHNRYLELEVSRRMRENEQIKEASLHAMAVLAETRDHETGNHLQRTQAYVEALALQLRRHPEHAQTLSESDCRQIARAAPLHDIGKVGIPDAILQKPGRLTPQEFEVMKGHAAIGGEAIATAMARAAADPSLASAQGPGALSFLEIARQIASCHHEKWDGSGYPAGLAGRQIPLPARLMALADVYDALRCRRVYKPPMPLEQVEAMLEEGRGRHFDPQVVDAYHAVRQTFLEISKRYEDEPVQGLDHQRILTREHP